MLVTQQSLRKFGVNEVPGFVTLKIYKSVYFTTIQLGRYTSPRFNVRDTFLTKKGYLLAGRAIGLGGYFLQ